MAAAKNIETGVDKLVEIVNRKKKVPLADVAKELGVNVALVQEWADFLEEEGLITIEDNLKTTYLCERKLTKTEVEKKAKEYDSKKDAFVSKVESALSSLRKESEGLGKIKDEFEKLKEAIGGDIDRVREELQELKHYEDLKKNIDKDILQQRLDYHSMLEGIHKKVTEERKRYEKYIEDIASEKSKIEEAKVELNYLIKKQENLMKRIEALKEIIKGAEGEITTHKNKINDSLSTLEKQIKEADSLQKSMKYRLEVEMEPLVKKVKDNEERVLAVQNNILQKVTAKSKEIDKYKIQSTEAADKFKLFFAKRLKTQDIIAGLEKERKDLEKEFTELIAKAKSFNLSVKSADVRNYVKDLDGSLKNIDKKRASFSEKLSALTDFISKKD